MARLFDYPDSIVEAETSVIFCLDPDLRITYCNPAWDRFAIENGGNQLCRPAPIGRSILDFINGSDHDYFEQRYKEVLRLSQPWERDYECSSQDVYRKCRLRAVPMKTVPGVFVINSLVVEHRHQLAASEPLENVYRTREGLIVMCANCRRTRRNAAVAAWDWVPSFVEKMPARTSHGVCSPCRAIYYPEYSQ